MASLKVYIFPDLLNEELACVEACLNEMKTQAEIEEYRVVDSHRACFKKSSADAICWVIARDWRGAIDYLSIGKNKDKTFVSVLCSQAKPLTPWETWFSSWLKRIPSNVVLVAHSALSYQFLKELVGIGENQLLLLPLSLPILQLEKDLPRSRFTIGTFGSLSPENNLHFVLALAHYVLRKDSDIQFRLVGKGPLKEHLSRLKSDLHLGSQVEIIESNDAKWVQSFDVALNFSHHNDHFISELLSGTFGVVPLSAMSQGIENYIQDSSNGFIVPLDETKTIGELILTLKQNPLLHREMGARFRQHMTAQFGPETVAQSYLENFEIPCHQNKNFIRCAR